MNTYRYTSDNYDPSTLEAYLGDNMVEACYPNTAGSIISIQTEADKAALDIVMDAYLAQDNDLLTARATATQVVTEVANTKVHNIVPSPYSDYPASELHLMMDMIALTRKEANGLATAEELLELTAGEDARVMIKDIRTSSQEIILDIAESLDPLSIDIENHIAWP